MINVPIRRSYYYDAALVMICYLHGLIWLLIHWLTHSFHPVAIDIQWGNNHSTLHRQLNSFGLPSSLSNIRSWLFQMSCLDMTREMTREKIWRHNDILVTWWGWTSQASLIYAVKCESEFEQTLSLKWNWVPVMLNLFVMMQSFTANSRHVGP